MTIPAFYHEERVGTGSIDLRLVMNFRAIDAVEAETQRPFDGIVREFTARRANPPLALQARVVWGLLREYHPDISIDQAMALVNGTAAAPIGVAIGKLFVSGWPQAFAAKKGKPAAHPPRPRGASKISSSAGAPSA